MTRPAHVSKGEGYEMRPGDRVQVRTPGGGGYGPPRERSPEHVARDLIRGYFTRQQLEADYPGVLMPPQEGADP